MAPKMLDRSKVKTRRVELTGALYRYKIEVEYDGTVVGTILALNTDETERHYQSLKSKIEAGSDDPTLRSRVVLADDRCRCPYIWHGLSGRGNVVKLGGGKSEDEATDRLLTFVRQRLEAHGKL